MSLEGTISYTGKLCTSNTLLPLVTTCADVVNEPITPATYYEYNGGDVNSLASFTRVRIMDFPSFDRGPARTDCTPNVTTGVTCTQAQEYQNFANWFVYNRNRTYVAIAASSQAFAAQSEQMRVGYGRIGQKKDIDIDGVKTKTLERGVRLFSGVDRDAFFNWLYLTPAESSTHLRRAVGDVGEYYSRTDNKGPWGNTPGSNDPTAHLSCRKSYNILMTDGYWNSDPAENKLARLNVDGLPGPVIANPAGGSYQYLPSRPFSDLAADTLADVAMFYWNRDLRPDLANSVKPDAANPAFWQHMVNFTVGMGVDGTLRSPEDLPDLQSGAKNWPLLVPGDSPSAIDDLWHAAINSRGRYLSAADPTTFAVEMTKILEEIANRNASEAGVSVSSQVLQVGNRKYVPGYVTGDWSGSITAIELDAAGQQLSPVWEASSKIPAYDSRNIFVGTRDTKSPRAVPFTWPSLSSDMRKDLSTKADSALVDYLRGDSSLEGNTYRRRTARLGDVVNSQPTFVKGLVNLRYNMLPAGTPGASTYTAFVEAKKARPGMLFVGANDGMLHAFRDSDGVEDFAFIPRSMLTTMALLSAPSYGHRYYVDGPLTESDAYFGGGWKNVLVGTTGAGARGLFALDVTNTASMGAGNVLWEMDDTMEPEIGNLLAPVDVGLMKNGKWAAVFGNGYVSASGKAQLFIVDLQSGALIKRIDTGVGGVGAAANGMGGARLIRDGNQVIVGAYAGDLKGNVWKFDLSSTSVSDWKVGFSGNPLYVAKDSSGVPQPITARPTLVAHPRSGNMVLVGTGKLFEEGDQNNVAPQSIYGLWDKQSLVQDTGVWKWSTEGAITTASTVKTRALKTTVVVGSAGENYYTSITGATLDWNTDRGWTLPLAILPGQRSTLSPRMLLGMSLFETIVPSDGSLAGDPCLGADAMGYSLLLDPLSGEMSKTPTSDVNGDGVVDIKDPRVAGWSSGKWTGSSNWLGEKSPMTPKDCTTDPAACLCPAGTKRLQGIGAEAGSRSVCFSIPAPTRWWWRQVMVQ